MNATFFLPFSFLLLVSLSSISGQSKATSKIVYYANHKLTKGNVCNGINSLYFNTQQSLFVHDNYPTENDMQVNDNFVTLTVGDYEQLPVFIDKTQKILYYKVDRILLGYSLNIIQEEIPTIEWKITNKTKPFEQLHAISAVGEFEGRIYDVWFSPQIPASVGPYKLGGLPGVILEAKSRDGKVSFEFQSYTPVLTEANSILIKKPENGEEMTLEELKELKIKIKLKKESQNTHDRIVTISDPSPDAYIERNKYNFIEQYYQEKANKKKN